MTIDEKKELLYLRATDSEIIAYATNRGFIKQAITEHYGSSLGYFCEQLMHDLKEGAIAHTMVVWITAKEMFTDFAEWYEKNHVEEKSEEEVVA